MKAIRFLVLLSIAAALAGCNAASVTAPSPAGTLTVTTSSADEPAFVVTTAR